MKAIKELCRSCISGLPHGPVRIGTHPLDPPDEVVRSGADLPIVP